MPLVTEIIAKVIIVLGINWLHESLGFKPLTPYQAQVLTSKIIKK